MRRLEEYLRVAVAVPAGWKVVIRGTPNTAAKLSSSAERMAGQYTYRSLPCFGVTVHVVAPADLHRVLRSQEYSTRHSYGALTVDVVRQLGLNLLPTFSNTDHYTLVFDPYNEEQVTRLADMLEANTAPNPHWVGRSSR
jgi:hypothetical protein